MARNLPDRAILARLDALYRSLPRVACTGKCVQACGAIALTIVEADRLRQTAHRKPSYTAEGIRCVYLRDGRCSVYGIRPLVCRLFGVIRSLSCPAGCVPDRWLTPHEQLAVFQELAAIVGSDRMYETTATGDLVPVRTSITELAQHATDADVDEADIARRDEMVRTLRALHGGRIRAVGRGGPRFVDMDEDRR